MDISEITKVASRKKINADAEKLREKVSRETAKIIKLKPREVNRRFEALTRGEPVKPASLNALKRRKAPSGGLKTIEEEDHVSLSQIKKNPKNDEPRKFFKNSRNDNKIKRIK